MATPECLTDISELNQAFIEQECAIEEMIEVYSEKNTHNLWTNTLNFPQGTFKYGEGYIKNKYSFHGTPAPQLERDNLWTQMKQSIDNDSETYAACNPDCVAVEYGFEQKQYQPYELCIKGDTICLEDMKFQWQFVQQMDRIYENLSELAMGVKENWNRDTYLSYATIFPAIPDPLGFGAAQQGVIPDAGALNAGILTQQHLDKLYQYLSRAAGKYDIGKGSNGQCLFGLITSPETSNNLMINNSERREDLRYDQASYLFEGYGADMTYRNFVHYHDWCLPRYVVDETQPNNLRRVYPWGDPTSTTIGKKWDISNEYLTAPYELSIIYVKDVFDNQVLPPLTSAGGNTSFSPTNYSGTPIWLNIQEECHNPYGNQGHFRLRFQWAPRPGATDHAMALIHKRCDIVAEHTLDCAPCATATCDTTEVEGNISTTSGNILTVDVTTSVGVACATQIGDTVRVHFVDGYFVDVDLSDWTSDTVFSITLPEGLDASEHGGFLAVTCP